MRPDFKPSAVRLLGVPLVGTFEWAEIEFVAAICVRACHARGDMWQPVTWDMARAVLREDYVAKREPFASLLTNPFFKPDIHKLVDRGFATWGEEQSVEFTAAGFDELRRWIRPTTALGPGALGVPEDAVARVVADAAAIVDQRLARR